MYSACRGGVTSRRTDRRLPAKFAAKNIPKKRYFLQLTFLLVKKSISPPTAVIEGVPLQWGCQSKFLSLNYLPDKEYYCIK